MAISEEEFKSANLPGRPTNRNRLARLMGRNESTDYVIQEEHKPNTNQIQTQHKPNTEPDTERDTNPTQIKHKPNTNVRFSELVGLQRNMLIFAYKDCKNTRSKMTNFLTLDHISQCLNIRKGSVKTTISRLLEKGYLIKNEFKNGRAGWVRYEIPESIYRDLIHLETEHKHNTEHNTTLSSSGLKDLNTTTTQENILPPDWDEIDLSPLQKNNVLFGRGHIISLWTFLKIHSAFDFQESVDGFAFDIEHNYVNARRGYLNLFIGTIRNGLLYVSSHYVSPERQKINEMLELSKKRKAEKENLENKAFELATESWISDLTEEEKNNILSQHNESDIWWQCVKYLEKEHDAKAMKTWIKPLHAEEESGVWVLYAPNEFLKDEVKKTFSITIQKFLGDFVLKVGNKERADELKNPNNYSQEEITLQNYFKENLWVKKRAEFLAGV